MRNPIKLTFLFLAVLASSSRLLRAKLISAHQVNHDEPIRTNNNINATSAQQEAGVVNAGPTGTASSRVKCSRHSIILSRQMLANELDSINHLNAIWLADLDKDELLEEQKQSLSNLVISTSATGAGQKALDAKPMFELESSNFRPSQGLQIKLERRHPDKCQLNLERGYYAYQLGLSVGPLEHNMELVYNLPHELKLSQPIDWKYAQVRLLVPRMNFEVTLRQKVTATLQHQHQQQQHKSSSTGCSLELADVTYVGGGGSSRPTIFATGLAHTNETRLQLDRLFDDYTRPTVSQRLKQALKFYLSCKTLPLTV